MGIVNKKRWLWIAALIVCQSVIILFQYNFSQGINSKLHLEIQHQTEESAKRTVNLAYNSVEHILEKTRTGEIGAAEARTQICDIVRKLVYNDDMGQNYVFMSSYDGTMLVQPFDRTSEGTNQLDLKDSDGNYIIQKLIEAAKEHPQGSFVQYNFYPPGHSTPENKLSYVRGLPEIDAYIGTGMYSSYSFAGLKQVLTDQKQGYTAINLTIFLSLLIFIITLYRSNKLLSDEVKGRIEAEDKIMAVFDTIYDGVLVHDNDGRILQANRSCCDIFAVTEEEILGMSILDLADTSPEAQQDLEKTRERVISEGFLCFEWKGRRPHTGELFDEEIISKKCHWSGQEAYVLAIRDISEKKRADEKLREQYQELETAKNKIQQNHEELTALYEELSATEEELRKQYEELSDSQQKSRELMERYLLVAEGASDIIWDLDHRTDKLFVSDRFAELLGYSKGEIKVETKEDYWKYAHPEDRLKAMEILNEAIAAGEELFTHSYRMFRKDGSICWFNSRSKFRYGDNGEILRHAGSTSDITKQKQYEEEIMRLAYYDYLTGLPNRVSFVEELRASISECLESSLTVGVSFIDLDNFKFINDTFGHSYGDRALVLITERLESINSDNVKVFRIGGDEFIVINKKCSDASECEVLANRLLSVFAEPICIDENSFHITCSIGVALYPRDGYSAEEILKNADLAMYKAKNSGKNRYKLYEKAIAEELAEKLQLESDLAEAFRNGEFELHYQPQVETNTGKVAGFEALLRWNSPKHGMVSPARFIPVAEDTGLINDLGEWVIEQTFAFARKLQEKGICVSCNVSPIQLIQSDFTDTVIKLFHRYQLQEGSVALEITENSLMESFEDTNYKLKQLRDEGILIYLDDFGTGYSSLTYLKSLAIDVVKIDKLFVNDIKGGKADRNIVESIISLAHSIGLKVVAEGVEDELQREYLTACRCCFIQGYLISRPVPEELAVTFLS